MKIIRYKPGDIIELRKPHPCGSKRFKVLRVGSDMRVLCIGCGRDMNVDRIKLEKATKAVLSSEEQTENEQ